MTGTGFRRLTTASASTKRLAPVGTDGLAGSSGTYITQLWVTPPAPLSTPVSARNDVTMISPILENPFELLQVFCEGNPDVQKGDTLVINGKQHRVAFVEPWNFQQDLRLRIMLERPDDR